MTEFDAIRGVNQPWAVVDTCDFINRKYRDHILFRSSLMTSDYAILRLNKTWYVRISSNLWPNHMSKYHALEVDSVEQRAVIKSFIEYAILEKFNYQCILLFDELMQCVCWLYRYHWNYLYIIQTYKMVLVRMLFLYIIF